MARFLYSIALVGSVGLGQVANAQVSINFDPLVNADITTFTGGGGYPQMGGTVTIAGIDHVLAKTSTGRTGSMFFANNTKVVPVGVFGVKEVYTLINSTVGAFGAFNGKVEFFGAGGAYQTFDLIQGDNIRDHYNGSYNNVASNLNGTISYTSGVRFDQQKFVLDTAFHSVDLVEIKFVGSNNAGSNGSPMLQSLTVNPVPEPATIAALGLGLAAVIRRKRSK